MWRSWQLRIIGSVLVATAAGTASLPAWTQAAADTAPPAPAAVAEGEAPPALPYALGRGLRLAQGALSIGGYLTAEARQARGESAQLRLSHASVFVWWEPLDRLKVFGELDYENAIAQQRVRGRSDGMGERRTSLERLHASWTFNDSFTLRAGKFLSPIGRWNLVHAGPLVWTSSRPLLTQSVVPNNVTGLMAQGSLPLGLAGLQGLDYALYGAEGRQWASDPLQDPFTSVRGLRLVLPLAAQWQLGLSYARYEQEGSRGESRWLGGLDARYSQRGVELSAEWLSTQTQSFKGLPPPSPSPGPARGQLHLLSSAQGDGAGVQGQRGALSGSAPREFGGGRKAIPAVPTEGAYVQAVVPLAATLFGVARLERMRESVDGAADLRQSTLGLTWRPIPTTAVKLEHQWAHGRPDRVSEGWIASLSALF